MAIEVKLDTQGRRGKTVTMISNIQHNPQVIEDLARELKKHCGTGGTHYKKTIELQGDKVDQAKAYLRKKGMDVK